VNRFETLLPAKPGAAMGVGCDGTAAQRLLQLLVVVEPPKVRSANPHGDAASRTSFHGEPCDSAVFFLFFLCFFGFLFFGFFFLVFCVFCFC